MAKDIIALIAISDKDIYPEGEWKTYIFGFADPGKACGIFSIARNSHEYEESKADNP